jgi:RNA recognition motif-containing protein
MKDPVSRRSRGFGFITYVDIKSVDTALDAEPHTIDSRKVEAKRSVPRLDSGNNTGGSAAASSSTTKASSATVVASSVNTRSASKRAATKSAPSSVPVSSSSITAAVKIAASTTASSGSTGGTIPTTDDDHVSYTKVFIGGLHYETRETDIRNYFDKFGTISSAEVMFNRETHKSRGFGFVVFDTDVSARAVCSQAEHVVNGKKVEVKLAIPRSQIPPGATAVAIAGMAAAGTLGEGVPSQQQSNAASKASADTESTTRADAPPLPAPAIVSSPDRKKGEFSIAASQIGQPIVQKKKTLKVNRKEVSNISNNDSTTKKEQEKPAPVEPEPIRPVSFAAALKMKRSNSDEIRDALSNGNFDLMHDDGQSGNLVGNDGSSNMNMIPPLAGGYLSALKSSLGPADAKVRQMLDGRTIGGSLLSGGSLDNDKSALFDNSSLMREEDDHRLRSQSNLSVASLASSVLNASSHSSVIAPNATGTPTSSSSPWTEPASLSLSAVPNKDRSPSLGDISWLQKAPSELQPLDDDLSTTSHTTELLGSRTERAGSITADGSVGSDDGHSTHSSNLGKSTGIAEAQSQWQNHSSNNAFQQNYQQQNIHYGSQNQYMGPPGWPPSGGGMYGSQYGGPQFDQNQHYHYQEQRYQQPPSQDWSQQQQSQQPYSGQQYPLSGDSANGMDSWNSMDTGYYAPNQQQHQQSTYRGSGGLQYQHQQASADMWSETDNNSGSSTFGGGPATQYSHGMHDSSTQNQGKGLRGSSPSDDLLTLNSLRLVDSNDSFPPSSSMSNTAPNSWNN